MILEHVAIWTDNLEESQKNSSHVKYFGGVANSKYINESKTVS